MPHQKVSAGVSEGGEFKALYLNCGQACVGAAEKAFPLNAVLRKHGDCAWCPQMGTEWVQDCKATVIRALFLVFIVKSPIVWNNDTAYLHCVWWDHSALLASIHSVL